LMVGARGEFLLEVLVSWVLREFIYKSRGETRFKLFTVSFLFRERSNKFPKE
ncbi:hypothetical protein L9F63_019351, partial [Diploptera punctata]